ncbi:MAG: trehalose-phosphatase [Steroidobacteraceae bacterium]
MPEKPSSCGRTVPATDLSGTALFLDVDGTLLRIRATPDAVVADPSLVSLLLQLTGRLEGALALVSGRSGDQLDRLFAPARFAVAAEHGNWRRDGSGRVHQLRRLPLPMAAYSAMRALVTADTRLLLEVKDASLALHYRRASERRCELRRYMQRLAGALAPDHSLVNGKMVSELRPAGVNKGSAIAQFMREPPFAGRRPVFVGDDLTDEDGFAVVNACGGVSAHVGRRKFTAARYQFSSVAAVRAWLEISLRELVGPTTITGATVRGH